MGQRTITYYTDGGAMPHKSIVLTMYGTDETVESFSISLCDEIGGYHAGSSSNAVNYCNTINALELKDGQWIHARVIREHKKIILRKPSGLDIFNQLHDAALQRVLRDISTHDLAHALIPTDTAFKERVFRNMSKRAAGMVQEDMEIANGASKEAIKSSQKTIVETIQTLIDRGDIVLLPE